MPLLDSTPSETDAAVAHFPAPPAQDQQPSPSLLDTMAAAERSGNIVGQLYSRISNDTLSPQGPAEPGFNPVDHIPAGYLHQYGARFLTATNPAQVQQVKRQIDSELADQGVLARAGWGGTAASFAAGLTDPLNLATMALVPEAAPTRLGNMLRWGLTNAASSATQELVSQQLSETRTVGESLTNVGAGAVLGGLLGTVAARVPKGEFERIRAKLAPELKGEGEEVLGPERRSVTEAAMDGPVVPEPQEMRARPEYVPPKPEGPTRPTPGKIPDIEPHRMSLSEAIAVSKGAGAEKHGLSLNEAIAQGLDPADLKSARFGSRPVFTRGGASFDAMAESLAQHGYPVVDETGAYSPNALLDALDKELRGNKQYSHAAGDYLSALEAHEKASAGAEQVRPGAEYEADLERDAAMLESKAEEAEGSLPGEPAYVNPETESTMGAAAVGRPSLEGLTVARGAQTLQSTVGRVTPAGRIMSRESVKARQVLSELANLPGTLEQNYHGIANPSPVERVLWGYDGLHVEGVKARRAAYGDYVTRMKEEGGQAMSRRDFMESVASAMRRGDKSPVPEVAKAAKWTRENIFSPLYERAKKLGLTPEEAELHADSYLTRQYDTQKIRENFGEWINTLRQGFIRQGIDPAEATDIAHAASRNVMASEKGLMDWHAMDGIVPKSGNLKERTLRLPDEILEPFLNNDIDHLTHSYLRSMAPEVEITQRFGSRDLKDQFQEITDEYAHMIEQARAAGDDARMAALDKERNATLSDLGAIRDRLYGIYGAPKDPSSFPVRAGRLIRNTNALRLLGAATLAHFPDLANVITRYGMANTFGAMAKLATSMQGMKLAVNEAQRMGAAIDMVMNVSASLLGDYGSHSRFLEQRVSAGLARGFTILTGETPLITAVQAMTSTLASDEILRTAEKVASGGEMNAALTAKLAAAGIDEPMLRRIAEASTQHAREVNGLRFGMSDQWADQKAAQVFESAVLREAHGVTLRPGAGDTPLFMSSELGKFVLQFKSFGFAASRVVDMPIMQGLAHGDLRTAEAIAALVAMGTLSYVAKQKAAGQPLEENSGRLALEVLDKSNLLGWTGEVIFPALWQAGLKDLSRWSDRDPVESLLGPGAGLVASTYQRQLPARLANLVSGGEIAPDKPVPFRRADLHFLRRMAPGQNLWYFRRGVNALEDGIGDLFDLPGESLADRELSAENRQ